MKNNDGETVTRRLLLMGMVSIFLHGIIAAVLLMGTSPAKENIIYRVELMRIQTVPEQAEIIEPAVPEQPEPRVQREMREEPAIVEPVEIFTPISPEVVEPLEEVTMNADTVETPIPPVENAVITPGGGLGSGEDAEAGGGNSMLAAGTESGWGGALSGEGWGGGSGSPGSGGGTGGGFGSGSGNSRGSESGEETGIYFAGMPGIVPPVYQRTPQPNYPEAARKRGEQGDVLLKIEVLVNGRVGRAEVAESSGFALLDDTALRTVRNWRFKPALKGREEVACWVNIPIKFRLNK